jgi:hypothetical protein
LAAAGADTLERSDERQYFRGAKPKKGSLATLRTSNGILWLKLLSFWHACCDTLFFDDEHSLPPPSTTLQLAGFRATLL